MIGVKSLAVAALAAGAVTIAILDGDLDPERFAHLSAGSAFAIGLFASAGGAVVGWSARPEVESRIALALRGGRPALVLEPARGAVRELPPVVQRLVLVGVFACIALATFTNEATARLAAVPAALAEPSRAGYCHDDAPAAAPAAVPATEAPPVDQAGCALVVRAFELGYANSLGSCAPRPLAIPQLPAARPAREPCTRRQLDEPFAHFAWRRVVDAASGVAPIDSTRQRVDAFRTRLDYLGDLVADVEHSITGSPHASHHLWVNLPDPHARSWRTWFTGEQRCASVFADLPLWPRWTEPTRSTEPAASADPEVASALFEHVFGQLLFATRFGTPASCSDYTIHWDAPPDACARLAADPTAVLDEAGALAPIRAVLDRRERQLAIRRLAHELGGLQTLPAPPETRAVVSVGCFIVDRSQATGREPAAGAVTGRDTVVDGQPIAIRELRAPAIRATGDGPIDVYVELAWLLGGRPYAGPAQVDADRVTAEPPGVLDGAGDPSFLLLRLEPLVDADPFAGRSAASAAARRAIERPDVAEVYPFEHHLFGFVDAFRRVYLAQRGRL